MKKEKKNFVKKGRGEGVSLKSIDEMHSDDL